MKLVNSFWPLLNKIEIASGHGCYYNVTDNDQERIQCLKQILRINPKNERANKFLAQLKNDSTQTKENIIESPKTGERLKNILFVIVIVVCCVMFILNAFNKSPNPGNGTAHQSQSFTTPLDF